MKKYTNKINKIFMIMCILLFAQSYTFAQDAKTEAYVEFEAGTGPTVPVHPEDPDVDSNIDGTEGSLAIVCVSDFDFGTKLPVKAVTWQYDIQMDMPNIQVVDLRGTGAGWRVSAKVSEFTSDGENQSLPGAAIFIHKGRPISKSVSDPPIQKQPAKLTTDNEQALVLEAPADAGTGLWVMRWYPPLNEPEAAVYIQLEIPAGAATIGSHTAKINWILEDTPSK